MSEWKQGMLNCCHDGETCLLGFPCCFSCTSYRNAKGLGKPTPLLYGLLGCFLPCFAINILRGEAREQHRIWNLLKKLSNRVSWEIIPTFTVEYYCFQVRPENNTESMDLWAAISLKAAVSAFPAPIVNFQTRSNPAVVTNRLSKEDHETDGHDVSTFELI